jgi:dimethylhistidine N-methyltransferase
MTETFKTLKPKDLEELSRERKAFSLDVLNGLSETPKRMPTKYHYDENGSRLFQKIMELPEYYPTRCETEILQTQKEKLAQLVVADNFNLVEMGAGDGKKTKILLSHFLKENLPFRYVPLDISESAMRELVSSIRNEFPNIETTGIVAEYFDGLKWLSTLDKRRNFVLFLGSNLGNFNESQARVFLRSMWNTLHPDDLILIGFDLKKDIDLMLDAYNDSQGVTAEFNLNLLTRINRELQGNFIIKNFRHYATYEVMSGAIESYLVSLEKQTVFIKEIGQTFEFESWEPIHTEYSYKYLETDIEKLAAQTGYVIEQQLFDPQKWFVDSVWRVQKAESFEQSPSETTA